MHGGGNGEHGNLPHPEDGSTVPLYGAAAAGSARERNNNHHHGKSNATLTCISFYHCLFFFIFSAAMGISLCT